MSIRTKLARTAAGIVISRINKMEHQALENQKSWFERLILEGRLTKFGNDHRFHEIRTYDDFKSMVPVRDYEGLRSYFDAIHGGESDVTWPGKPKYLAKTSGTTSGTKYIPITRQSLPNHINSARNALFCYLNRNSDSRIFDGRMLFLSGSPALEEKSGMLIGRLSGIVNHEVPAWLTNTMLPSKRTNLLEPWEKKVDSIIEEMLREDVRVVSGIPPWIQMIFERMLALTGKNAVKELLPHLELYIHGGVNYLPYKARIDELVGKSLNLVETYPASEGFMAYQDDFESDGMRLISNSGIFYEFILAEEVNKPDARRFSLEDVQTGKDYAIILNSNAGLWGYLIGDLVRFISTSPYRLKVTGRVSQFISAFGEHVIASEIEKAMAAAVKEHRLSIVEFLVAPNVTPAGNALPYHEWFVEFEKLPDDLGAVCRTIDGELCKLNTYYNDLIRNRILQTLRISPVRKGGFHDYMSGINKIGEQFKVTRLCNDRLIADKLEPMLLK